MHTRSPDMCRGPIAMPLLRYTIPLFLTGLLQRLFVAADMILASNLGTSGSDAVAAVGSTTALTNLLIGFFVGCSSGSAVSVSHALGEGNHKLTKQTVHTAMLLSAVIGAIMMLIGLFASKSVLVAMNTPRDILSLATTYLRTYFCGMIPCMVYNFGAAILRTAGDSRKPLYFLLISGPVKLLLTVIFVSVCNMDVAGLALATTLSQVLSAVLVVIALMKRADACKLILRELRFHAFPVKKILSLGIPAGIQTATFSFSGVIIQSSVNSLAHLEGFITGNSAAASIEGIAEATTAAFMQAGMSYAGQNTGAKQYDRVKKILFWNCALCSLFILVISPLVLLFDRQLLGLYITDSPQAVAWGTVRVAFIFIPLLFQGLMDAVSGVLRGLGASVSSMIINLAGICALRILWLLTVFPVPQYHTPQCLYIIYPITWVLTTVAELILYKIVIRKKTKALKEQSLPVAE
ncbi:MAG: MATE family efflux transporter [Oscillospiraceae bacterium]|nr:MATE family efflux transporter [Oscillospiraceae bacterium]